MLYNGFKNLLILFSIFIFSFSHNLFSTKLSWQVNSETDLQGYQIYYGTESGNYTVVIDVGKVTEYEIQDLESGREYFFIVTAYDFWGNESEYPEEIVYTKIDDSNSPTDVKRLDNALQPTEFDLKQNYPNPFNPSTTIEYKISKPGYVKLSVFNALGQLVKVLVDSDEYHQTENYHSVVWDGRDKYGDQVSNGIYYYKIQQSNISEAKCMTLMR